MDASPPENGSDFNSDGTPEVSGTCNQPAVSVNPFFFSGPNPHINESSGAVVLEEEMEQNQRLSKASSLEEAKDILKASLLDNSTCKSILRALKVTGAQNAKVVNKLKILAVKMVQRQFSIADAIKLFNYNEGESSDSPHFLSSLKSTSVRIKKDSKGQELFEWVRGDVPVCDGEEVKVGQPDLGTEQNTCPSREPDFEAAEHCRLLHVLADPRMITAGAQLMEPRTGEELGSAHIDPWSDVISTLYNDTEFEPSPVETLSGGITRSDIASINTRLRPHERNGGVLKRKFGEFKSLYGTCLSKYEASGQGHPDSFFHFARGKTYIMYAFCFLKVHPILTPLATRALQSDAQREEGVGDGVGPTDEYNLSGRKRKREAQGINILGIESLSSAFKPCSEQVAKETEEAERDKAKFEAAEARGRSTQSLLAAISQAKKMQENAQDDEKDVYDNVLRTLFKNLTDNGSS